MSSLAASRALVDLNAYAHNLGVVRELIPDECHIMAVIKSDAYGHGLVPIALRAVAEGVAMLGVATVEEGIALREAEITAPILVMVEPDAQAIAAAIEHNLRLMMSDVSLAERVGEQARKLNRVVPVHCKVDTGMGRQGVHIDRAANDMLFLTRISHIDIEGIATHFPCADSTRENLTGNQVRLFRQLLREVDKEGIPYEVAHASNSAAVVNYPGASFDMVRPGLMTYGVWPTPNVPEDPVLRPVLRWETRIRLIRELEAGSSVGYGHTYTTKSRMRIALLPVGYADGYMHSLGNEADVLIRGKRCPVRGAVSMDQIVVDITHLQEVSVGETAVLIGSDVDETITVEELAQKANTIPYEILTGIGPRVERVYVD